MTEEKDRNVTMTELERLWLLFEKALVYKCLVNGKWYIRTDFDEAKSLQPLRIEIKKAKECMKFPVFLKAKLQCK